MSCDRRHFTLMSATQQTGHRWLFGSKIGLLYRLTGPKGLKESVPSCFFTGTLSFRVPVQGRAGALKLKLAGARIFDWESRNLIRGLHEDVVSAVQKDSSERAEHSTCDVPGPEESQSGHRKCGVRVFATTESAGIRTWRTFILVGLVTPSVFDRKGHCTRRYLKFSLSLS